MNNLRQQIAVQNDEHPPQQMAVEDRHFPLILHDILDYSECTGDVHTIVSWHPEGCAFKIHNIQKFIQILPLFFRHKNYKSFQRQLNHYAFERIWEGPEKGCYKHENFVRGDRKLAIAINPQRGNHHASKQQQESSSKRHIDSLIKVAKEMERDSSMIKKESLDRPKKKKFEKSVLQDRGWLDGGDFVPMMQNYLPAADASASTSMAIMRNHQYTAVSAAGGGRGGPAPAIPSYEELLPSHDFYYTTTRHGLPREEQQYSSLLIPPAAAPPPGGFLSLTSACTTTQKEQQLIFNNLKEEADMMVVRQMWWATTIGQQQQQQVAGDQGSRGGNSIHNSIQKEIGGSSYYPQHAAAPSPPQNVPPAALAPAAAAFLGEQEQPRMKQQVRRLEDSRRRSSSSGWPKPVPLELLPVLDFCCVASTTSGRGVQGEGEVLVGNSRRMVAGAAERPPLPAQNQSNDDSDEEDEDGCDEESSLVSLLVEDLRDLEQTSSSSLLQRTTTTTCGGEEEQFEQHDHTDLLSCFEDMRGSPRPGRSKPSQLHFS